MQSAHILHDAAHRRVVGSLAVEPYKSSMVAACAGCTQRSLVETQRLSPEQQNQSIAETCPLLRAYAQEMHATKPENFSSEVNDLFAQMMAEAVRAALPAPHNVSPSSPSRAPFVH